MGSSVWEATLASFREQVARGPAPAGVSVSAVAATLGLGLLAMVLEVSRKRKDFAGDRARLEQLRESAAGESARLMECADQDVAAFNAYLSSRRMPRLSADQRAARTRALADALREAIEVPLKSARAAANGIDLCAETAGMMPGSVAADLAAAVTLLAGALRATLLSVDSNLGRLSDSEAAYREEVAEERRRLEERAARAERVLARVSGLLGEVR